LIVEALYSDPEDLKQSKSRREGGRRERENEREEREREGGERVRERQR